MDKKKYFITVGIILAAFLLVISIALLIYINTDYYKKQGPDTPLHRLLDRLASSDESFNVLLMGGDQVAGNTDTIMLINYRPSDSGMSILSVPRDTKVNIKGSVHKINAAFPLGGIELASETVSKLLGTSIKYTVFIDTSTLKEVIDLLGGLDYYIPVDMIYSDPIQGLSINLKKGQQHLNGDKSLQFLRFRQPMQYNNEILQYYDGSDLKRIDSQQSFLKEIIKQKANIKYIGKAKAVWDAVFGKLKTNITTAEVLKYAGGLGSIKSDNINNFRLPGMDSQESGGWYYILDGKQVSEIISTYFTPGTKQSTKPATTGKTPGNVQQTKSPAAIQPSAPAPAEQPEETAVQEATEEKAPENNKNPDVLKGNPSNSDTSYKNGNGNIP